MKTTVKSISGWMARTGLALAAVLVAGIMHSPAAHADQMLLASTNMVSGTSNATFSFDAPSNGTVTATITSIPWPTPLSALSFSASSASDTLASWNMGGPTQMRAAGLSSADASAGGVETFQVGAGTYFAHISATAAGALNLGLYSVLLTFAPSAVPLPAAGGMLLIGLLVFFGLRRKLPAVMGPGPSELAHGV